MSLLKVDFQNSYIGSQIEELLYFFATSVNYEIARDFQYVLLYTYYDTMSTILRQFNYKGHIPDVVEFQQALNVKKAYGMHKNAF